MDKESRSKKVNHSPSFLFENVTRGVSVIMKFQQNINNFIKLFWEEPAKSRGLLGNESYVDAGVAWVKFLRGLRGLRGSKYFLRGSTFYVG